MRKNRRACREHIMTDNVALSFIEVGRAVEVEEGEEGGYIH